MSGGDLHHLRSAVFRDEHEPCANVRLGGRGIILGRALDLFHRAGFSDAACRGTSCALKTRCLLRQASPSQQRALHFQLRLQSTPRPRMQMQRHLYIVQLVLILTLCGFAFAAEAQVKGVAVVGMTVSDMDRTTDFYSALTFQKVSDVEVFGDEYEHLVGIFGARMRIVRMQLGNEFLELTEYLTPRGKPIPEDSRSNDLWFQHIAIVVSDMDNAFDKLRALGVQFVSTGPQRLPDWNIGAAGIKAFYFRDPDHHNLEVIYFPPGKGDPRWQEKTDKLFLGIDHTAIAVAHTDASLRFYSDLLGFRNAAESESYGTVQR